ncbi:glutathione S-transferase, partial [Conidiobolus coronatus NRRL 28638]
ENYDPEYRLWPKDSKLQSEVVQWLMFQMGGIGPMLGQANHFISYAPSKLEYAITRYVDETKRLINVLEKRLKDREFLVGDQLTIADISNVSWVTHAFKVNIDLQGFPNVNEWVERVESIPEVAKGYDVPTKSNHREMKKNPELLKKLLEENSKWIQKANNQ